MLALGFDGVLLLLAGFVPCLPNVGTVFFELARGVNVLVELERVDMLAVEVFGVVWAPFGGVGGRPIDGAIGVAMSGSAFSRGFLNIVKSSHLNDRG